MCKLASQTYLSLHGLLQGPSLKITRCFKTKFLECMFSCTEQTNKQTNKLTEQTNKQTEQTNKQTNKHRN